MRLTIFAKKRTSKEGREFTSYVTKLRKRDGSEVTTSVKFREDCGQPKREECPCYIDVDKRDANLTTKSIEITTEDGEIRDVESKTLWVQAWTMNPEKYVDTSLDDFED